MGTVAITGVAGLLGRRLVGDLGAVASVDRIVGIDVRAPAGLTSRKLTVRELDVRDIGLLHAFEDVEVVVHLAWQVDPIQDEATMRSVNVDGTRNVFHAAARAGVRKVIHLSSGVVYGAHPDNDLPLTEESPLRANPDFGYVEHKLEVERWLWPWLEEHPELVVTVLRPGTVAGPGVDNFMSRLIELPRPTIVRGHKPPMQFAHVEDVAAAIVHAIRNDLPGAYNVCAEGWLSMDEILAVGGRRPVEVPEEVAVATFDRLWRLGIGESPPGLVHYLMHPWVLSPDKLIATGWRPRHSNRDALAELVEEHRDHVAVGRLRTRRSTLRRAALSLALLGLAAGVTSRRRRERDP